MHILMGYLYNFSLGSKPPSMEMFFVLGRVVAIEQAHSNCLSLVGRLKPKLITMLH